MLFEYGKTVFVGIIGINGTDDSAHLQNVFTDSIFVFMNPLRNILVMYFLASGSNIMAQKIATVVNVKDGDTYVLQTESKTFIVRLNKIDAPEMKQGCGYNSYIFVRALINNKTVQYDSIGKDRYGRTIANIKFHGKRLDSIIIKKGWAWHYLKYDKEVMLDKVMEIAIRRRLGLWKCGKDKVCPPWIWRRYNEQQRTKYCKDCNH